MNFVPATIKNEDETFSLPIVCHFAPETISVSKTNIWRPRQPRFGQDLATPQFTKSNPGQLKIKLWLDATEIPGRDVQGDADKLLDLMKPTITQSTRMGAGKGKGGKAPHKRPPVVTFQWGATLSFKCVLKTVSIQFTLFNPAGRPLRATADCTFQQIQSPDEFPKTNPTSGGRTGETIVRLAPRETLDGVAYRSFGRTDLWRAIAAFNGIDDPLRLQPGAEILLPASVDELTEFA
jgi:hypothetical protein